MTNTTVDFSIVIPTWNRKEYVERLLKSIAEDRESYIGGSTEIIVVDSSMDEERNSIMESCKRYDARYVEGPDSVRKKRNMGIIGSQFDHILFLDSDVIVEKGLLEAHARVYEESQSENLGGTFGVTEFYGERTFIWKVVEYTNYTVAFDQAKKYPYVNWTIGNNVSFVKKCLEDIGMFEENLPFKLGGDDLDLSYRVVASGHPIKCTSEAVTYHSRETWNSIDAINNRTRRWGTMEYYNSKRHWNLMKRTLPGLPAMFSVSTLSLLISFIISGSTAFLWSIPAMGVLTFTIGFACDAINSRRYNIAYYGLAKLLGVKYSYYKIRECWLNRDFGLIGKVMIFDKGHAMAEYSARSRKMDWFLVSSIAVFLADLLLTRMC